MTENELSALVIGEAIEIHKKLGPGLLERVYVECLDYRLQKLGLDIKKEQPIPVVYEEVRLEFGYRTDLIIENKLIVEAKSIEAIGDLQVAQLLTYLKFCHCKLGLLINFNVVLLKNGIRRVVRNL